LSISARTVAAFSVAPSTAQRMLVAVGVDADRRHQGHVLVHVNAVDLDHQQIEAGKIGRGLKYMEGRFPGLLRPLALTPIH
jgi:hypothetical protein